MMPTPFSPSPVIAVAVLPGPWGPIHLASRGGRIVALELLTSGAAFEATIGRRLRGPVVPAREAPPGDRALLARATDEVAGYLHGREDPLELPLDLGEIADWDDAVLGGVRRIPRGSVTSYGRLARLIGRPGAARAVGGAVGRNPIGILVPCHRVIAGDGSLGGYGGDHDGSREALLGVKRWLLEREGVELPASVFFEPSTVIG